MEGEEDYVAQLKQVFDDCDSGGDGFINQADLIVLCERLQVEDHANALVERLIGSSDHKKVGFEEFKDGFVAVLSQCADLLSTEEEVSVNSYDEDDAVSPKYVRDGRKYGRRSRPDIHGSETPLDFPDLSDIEMDYSYTSPVATPVADGASAGRKLHTTPVNQGLASLNSTDDLGVRPLSTADNSIADVYEGEGLLNKSMGTPGPGSRSGEEDIDAEEAEALRAIWDKQGVGQNGYLSFDELGAICENLGMDKMSEKDLQELFDQLDADNDGKLSFEEFVIGLNQRSNIADVQTNSRPHSSQSRRQLKFTSSMLDNERRTQTPSIFSAITGSGFFSCIDPQASGYAKPEDIVEFWESFGVGHEDAVAVLNFLAMDMTSKISLQELSSALEQELLNNEQDNVVYQVAIYSSRQELRYIKGALDTISVERDKLKEDVDASKRHNEDLVKEADERHTTQLRQHESHIVGVERKYQEQLRALNSQIDVDREQLVNNAQLEKNRLESENSELRAEERHLKQELSFHQRQLADLEKDMHSHIDRNSMLERENERIKRELSSLTETHKKMEERESRRTLQTDEQKRFSEQKIVSLENENKALRDREDELTLELEELKMNKNAVNREGQGQRRGSLLSDYTMMKNEETSYSDHSEGVDDEKQEVERMTEEFKLEILKLKDAQGDEIRKLKKFHATEKMDLQDAFKNDLAAAEERNLKKLAEMEGQLDGERITRSKMESDWRKKYEVEKVNLKSAASHDRMELMAKLQEDNREQLRVLRKELTDQHALEVQLMKKQYSEEKEMSESRFRQRIEEHESMFDGGADALRGALRENVYQIIEEQTQNEIEVEKRHLEASYEAERAELFELLNKEKQSMEDQFNNRLYELEDQMDDIEDNVKAECEEEFLEQIELVQKAFDEERAEYEGQIRDLKLAAQQAEEKLKQAADKSEVLHLRMERDRTVNERDEMQLEKNKMMLERNNIDREFEKLKKLHKEKVAALESRLGEAERLSVLSSQLGESRSAPTTAAPTTPASQAPEGALAKLSEEKESLERANELLTQRLEQSDEELFKLTAELRLVRSQHERQVQDLQMSVERGVKQETLDKLQEKLDKERERCRVLEKALNVRSLEGNRLATDAQEEVNKKLTKAQFERDEYKTRLLAMTESLREVTDRLKQQVVKSTNSDKLVRELYIENANLVEALYVTEKRQKSAEARQFKLEHRYESVAGTLNRFIPAALQAVSQG